MSGLAAAASTTTVGQTDEQALARKRQQIVALMQRFPFVRQCIKCSAKNLLRVDDIFLKAQQAVLYPFVPPLYDLETGQLTIECKRAFTRIFRMFDKDHDGLLSDMELDRFQRDTYHFAIVDRDLAAWKKVVTRNNPSETDERVLQDGKFTIQGFLTIFDVFISQNRLDVVWQALRKFNYDDDLNLHVPDSILNPDEDTMPSHSLSSSTAWLPSSWKLTLAAKQFLTKLFCQFDSDGDGFLSPEDVITMFSIFPPPALPPWHSMRAPELFDGCFSVPKESPTANGSSSGTESPDEFGKDTSLIVPSAAISALQQDHSILSTSGVSILSVSDSLPSVDVGGMYPLSKSISYLEWMGHWHTISAISPSISRAELYRLGHVEDYTRTKRLGLDRRRSSRSLSYYKSKRMKGWNIDDDTKKAVTDVAGNKGGTNVYYDSTLPSREIRVTVLGSRGCGKTALLDALCSTFNHSVRGVDTTSTVRPETSTTNIKLKRAYSTSSSSANTTSSSKLNDDREGDELVVHIVFTDIPETAVARQEEHYRQLKELFGSANFPPTKEKFCDLAILVFDCTDASSLAFVKDMEAKLLTNSTPRVFVGTKSDLVVQVNDGDVANRSATVLGDAILHCRESDLEPPLVTSVIESGFSVSAGGGGLDCTKVLDHLARCAIDDESGINPVKSKPHEAEAKRREAARRRKMMWLGGIVSVGVVVAVGVGLLWSTGAAAAAAVKKDQKGSFCWLRSFFGGGLRVPKESRPSS
jgi:GTPase SAR1 family protein/Ca2+-binding EF-hand superfamily protein